MSRSVQAVAQSGRRITEAAGDAATSATEMERASQSVAGLARKADDVTVRATREAEEGAAVVQKSIAGISRLRESLVQSSGVMREMGKRTSDITSIVDTINRIAERTNLLSLNASIEAARAGDAGRGFAVVAEEIRNLADRSAKATSDIAAIIKALQEVSQDAVGASNDGLRIADESNALAEAGGTGLKKILSGLTETAGVVSQITRASEEQRQAAQNAVTAVASTAEQARQVATATAEQATTAASIVQATGQMRKTAQEVAKAVGEQGRASRDIIKAAQSASRLAVAVRKATAEQAKSAAEVTTAVGSMRRGAATTTRALSEQVVASEQIAKSAGVVSRQAVQASKALAEQGTATSQIATAAASMRQQTGEAAKALAEQARAVQEISGVAASTARQIKQITRANKEHSSVSASLLAQLEDVRRITDRNAAGVQETRGSMSRLLEEAQALTDSVGKARATAGRGGSSSGSR
jgi:methyl-accepting chemotaxis protein